jgi:hypothetical protein
MPHYRSLERPWLVTALLVLAINNKLLGLYRSAYRDAG